MPILCRFCKKEYSSYSSRSNHIKKFHIGEVNPEMINSEIKNNHIDNTLQVNEDLYNCRKCDKKFKYCQNRWRHEKKCFSNNLKITTNDKKIELLEKQILELKDLLQKSLKIHPRTLQKINKQLNNTNNGTINNIQIIQLGKENLGQVLTENEKLKILNRQGMSVNDLVELVHTSDKYIQFKNILVTNLQSSFCYKYDDKMMSFIAVNKDELLNDVLEARIYDINTFYDELRHLMNPKKAETLEKFLDKMDDTDSKMRYIKKEEIKLILYNNRNKIKENQKVIEL
jgi:hypothetical protein